MSASATNARLRVDDCQFALVFQSANLGKNRRVEKPAAKKQSVLEPKELARIGSALIPMIVFHEVSRAVGPKGQTSKTEVCATLATREARAPIPDASPG